MKDDHFTFKQFRVRHRDAAMKVGTDSVLLGAWAFDTSSPKRILDVGTGCGILALMLAQRFNLAQIEAIELEEKAKQEAEYNFKQSPFSDQLKVVQGNFLTFSEGEKFDAIICNPPYYQDKISSSIPERNMARQERFLPPDEFWSKVNQLITPESGRVAVVVPLDRVKAWEDIAERNGFKLGRKCYIRGNHEAEVSRLILEWTNGSDVVFEEAQVIIEDQRSVLNASYLKWTHPFLLEK